VRRPGLEPPASRSQSHEARIPDGVNGSQVAEMITESNRSAVQPSQPFAGNTEKFTTPVTTRLRSQARGAFQLRVRQRREGGRTRSAEQRPGMRHHPYPRRPGRPLRWSGPLNSRGRGRPATRRFSTATVYELCTTGRLPHVRIVDSVRVRPTDIAVCRRSPRGWRAGLTAPT
jgi:hypothetical protein